MILRVTFVNQLLMTLMRANWHESTISGRVIGMSQKIYAKGAVQIIGIYSAHEFLAHGYELLIWQVLCLVRQAKEGQWGEWESLLVRRNEPGLVGPGR